MTQTSFITAYILDQEADGLYRIISLSIEFC